MNVRNVMGDRWSSVIYGNVLDNTCSTSSKMNNSHSIATRVSNLTDGRSDVKRESCAAKVISLLELWRVLDCILLTIPSHPCITRLCTKGLMCFEPPSVSKVKGMSANRQLLHGIDETGLQEAKIDMSGHTPQGTMYLYARSRL